MAIDERIAISAVILSVCCKQCTCKGEISTRKILPAKAFRSWIGSAKPRADKNPDSGQKRNSIPCILDLLLRTEITMYQKADAGKGASRRVCTVTPTVSP